MRILVLGGTKFVGRHIVAQLLRLGAEITLLHRGLSPSPFGTDVEYLVDDRRAVTANNALVLAKPWDIVIDTSGCSLDHVRGPLEHMRDVNSWFFVSTCGVYARNPLPGRGITEESPVLDREHATPETASAWRKLQCEQYLERELHNRCTQLNIIRLGLAIGPFDSSDRLAYWLERAMRAGETLIPMERAQAIQLIDVRDIAEFVSYAATRDRVLNVTGQSTTAQAFVAALAQAAGAHFEPVWVGEKFALANELTPWTEIPLWLPMSSPELSLMQVDSTKAETLGLRTRPMLESIRDTLCWWSEHRWWNTAWLSPAREKALLASWKAGR